MNALIQFCDNFPEYNVSIEANRPETGTTHFTFTKGKEPNIVGTRFLCNEHIQSMSEREQYAFLVGGIPQE